MTNFYFIMSLEDIRKKLPKVEAVKEPYLLKSGAKLYFMDFLYSKRSKFADSYPIQSRMAIWAIGGYAYDNRDIIETVRELLTSPINEEIYAVLLSP